MIEGLEKGRDREMEGGTVERDWERERGKGKDIERRMVERNGKDWERGWKDGKQIGRYGISKKERDSEIEGEENEKDC